MPSKLRGSKRTGPDWPEGCPAEKPAARVHRDTRFFHTPRVPRSRTELEKSDALLLIARRRDANTKLPIGVEIFLYLLGVGGLSHFNLAHAAVSGVHLERINFAARYVSNKPRNSVVLSIFSVICVCWKIIIPKIYKRKH